MPSGRTVDTSVRSEQYRTQCSSCHGVVDGGEFIGLGQLDRLPHDGLDFQTAAAAAAVVDLTGPAVVRQPMTFLHLLRPMLDADCVGCHAGAAPAGELSLVAEYSATANYPAGSRIDLLNSELLDFVPEDRRVPGYDFSVPYSWLFHNDNREYREHEAFADLVASHAPIAALAPWDPAYQNLMLHPGGTYRYLGGDGYASHYGRADALGGNARNAWLIEILSGVDRDPEQEFQGPDHTGFLSEAEVRLFQAVMDVGFPYMSRCDQRTVPSGPNAGGPWGDPVVTEY